MVKMTDSEDLRVFNYNDLNLDFFELSPPRATPVARILNTHASTPAFRPSAFKARQLAQKVAQSDELVSKLDVVMKENSEMQKKLKDFQKTAVQIQELYESEKTNCNEARKKYAEEELKSKELRMRCARLDGDLHEKKLHLEQLEGQIEREKGPLSFIDLSLKYLKLCQKSDEEGLNIRRDKTLLADLSKFCEENGCKVPPMKVKCKKKSAIKKEISIQCNFLEPIGQTNLKEYKTQSIQTEKTANTTMYIETEAQTEFSVMCAQTQTIPQENTAATEPKAVKCLKSEAVQTEQIELHSQGTQHISTTTTRGTSTSCFIKKHNVSTCFPEPTYVTPVTAMVDELLEFYNISPLSPITDPILPENALQLTIGENLVTPLTPHPSVTYKSTGTCTYLCNIQRQIDFIPLMTTIKRSQSNSPSPCVGTFVNIKREANTTPAPSPSPPPSSQSVPAAESLNLQTPAAAAEHTRRGESEVGAAPSLNHNLNTMQPMLSAFNQLPEMQPEVFSTIWQMAGQMFMGLFYSPSSRSNMRPAHLNIHNNNSIDQQQFNNWLYTLYESMQQQQQIPQQQQASTGVTHSSGNQQDLIGQGTHFDCNSDSNDITNTVSHQEEAALNHEVYNGNSAHLSTNFIDKPNDFGTDESTQTDNNSRTTQNSSWTEQKNRTDCVFKEPLEIPKRSVKQARNRKASSAEITYMKKNQGKQISKKRKREKRNKIQLNTSIQPTGDSEEEKDINDENGQSALELSSIPQKNERDFATAVEFCANLYSFNEDSYNPPNDNEEREEGGYGKIGISDNTASAEGVSLNALENVKCDKNANAKSRANQCSTNSSEGEPKHRKELGLIHSGDMSSMQLPQDAHTCGYEKLKSTSILSSAKLNITVESAERDCLQTTAANQINHCESLQNNEFINEPKSSGNPVKQNTGALKNVFRSVSEDEDSNEDLENASETMESQKAKERLNHKDEVEERKNVSDAVMSTTLLNQSETEPKKQNNNQDPQVAYNLAQEHILSDLSLSDSDQEKNEEAEEVKAVKEFYNNPSHENHDDEYEEAYEPALVIVEEEITGNETKKGTDSLFDGRQTNSPSPSKIYSLNGNDVSDSSLLLDNTLVDDLLSNTTTRKLYNSILKETASSVTIETVSDLPSSPKQGLKRKSELNDMTFCKRSASWRAQQQNQNDHNFISFEKRDALNEEIGDANAATLEDPNSHSTEDQKPGISLQKRESHSAYASPIEQIDVGISDTACTSAKESLNFVCSEPNKDAAQSQALRETNRIDFSESPASPPQLDSNSALDGFVREQAHCPEIPLELNRDYYPNQRGTILQHLIKNYSADIYSIVIGKKKKKRSDDKIALEFENFLNNTRDRVDVAAATLAFSLHVDIPDTEVIANLFIDQLINAPRPECELNCELASVPPKYIGTHLRLASIVLRHLQNRHPEMAGVLLARIENKLFNYQNIEGVKLEAALNLTQLYLLVLPMHNAEYNAARLFIAKCLYYYNAIAPPMIYEVLCWYPTALPSREETSYDRSDALITVIQHLLMCTTYNMDSKDLRHRELLSLLRFEYHFEPFKPKALEVLTNLVAKLKAAGQLASNLKYAFAIFCKRQPKLVDILLQQQLLPLADEYYKLVQHTNEFDERISALLECISAVVKPLPLNTDVSLYHSLFERFLSAVQRPVVQEAAVLAILRLQRFGQNRCFYALANFRPHYSLQLLTSNVLKTFIHKKPLVYWESLLAQEPKS